MRLAKLFNKGKRTASVPEVCNVVSDTVDTEMEALHISRTDNPYIQVLSSQDHLDQAAESSVVMSPDSISPTRSYEATKEYSLSEIHSHLVRSPPPVSWPLSPRSNGTFSPDSSDMDVDNPPLILPPKRGYSPYNRSQSEEHILSPCRELLKSAEFSPVSIFKRLIFWAIFWIWIKYFRLFWDLFFARKFKLDILACFHQNRIFTIVFTLFLPSIKLLKEFSRLSQKFFLRSKLFRLLHIRFYCNSVPHGNLWNSLN